MHSEDFRISVDKPGLKCCARDCSGTEEDGKFLFSFPPVTNKKSRKRCLMWVRKAGNVELLKYKLTELTDKFYLCSSHFTHEEHDTSHRKIPSSALPVKFDCTPLRFDLLNVAFSESSELDKKSGETDTKENCDESQVEVKADNGPEENQSESKTDEKEKHFQPEGREGAKDQEAEDTSASLLTNKTDSQENDNSSETQSKRNDSDSIAMKNHADPIANKSDDKLQTDKSACEISKKNAEPQDNQSCLGASEKQSDPDCQSKENTVSQPSPNNTLSQTVSDKSPRKSLTESVAQSDNIVVKQEVITDEHVDQVDSLQDKASKTVEETKTPGTSSPEKSTTDSPSNKTQRRMSGRKRETPTRKAKNDACDRLSGKGKKDTEELEPEKKIPKVVAGKKKNAKKVKGVFSNYQSPQKSNTPVITNIRSLLPQNGMENQSARSDMGLKTSPSNYLPFGSSVEPILRTTGTQTSVARTNKFLNILDSDRKLCVFSGIPSFEVLENITDATLKMVMNSEAMRSDIQPTMREWIIITCTKFMLNISIEAVSIMFGLAEDECLRIVEKTSLFLRRTLSLPDGQKYVWCLPGDVLNGIADFSDGAVNVG
ncbi:micronuclear linker histone polyprotein-like isoform X2 [Frankliniella occidentalis]|uniref:Micronuclear linker histone polyprotein-like isoform X2 n=1 Tax=Frankliniella occidentalis TaxID=133901 RepID=A0A6J1SBE1_FRAOC|nr:micronuclear linker histone polyprotein-like isoform X2 [Frankliniella occidentalis]